MRLVDAEKVAEAWKISAQKSKLTAENLTKSDDIETAVKGAIMDACADMMIALADTLVKDVPEIKKCKFHKKGEKAPMHEDLLLFDGKNYAVGTAMFSGESFRQYGHDLGFDDDDVKKWMVISELEELQ